MKKIMMIEDDTGLNQVIGDRLLADGYDFSYTTDGKEGLRLVLRGEYDLLLLDLMLSDVSGYDIIREIRSHGMIIPIIIISARFRKSDKITGFKLGADDYLVKPFDFDELQARIEAHIRREDYQVDNASSQKEDGWLTGSLGTVDFGSFLLDFKQCELFYRKTIVPLSKTEFRLLSYLVLNKDRVIPFEELMEKVWNYEEVISSSTLYVHIGWIRKKLKKFSQEEKYIRTVRGIGYQFKA